MGGTLHCPNCQSPVMKGLEMSAGDHFSMFCPKCKTELKIEAVTNYIITLDKDS
jgi:phage FluMu protein Com